MPSLLIESTDSMILLACLVIARIVERGTQGYGIAPHTKLPRFTFLPNFQSTRRPQNLIPADVSKNALSVHSTFRVTVCWPSYSQVKVSRLEALQSEDEYLLCESL